MLRMFNPEGAPDPGFYSQGVEAVGAQRMLFVSGQVGVRADGAVPDSVADQARAAIANLNAVLAGAAMDVSNLAKVTIYLTDEKDMPEFMAAAAGTLPSPAPATTLLIVKALASPALKIEIEAIAVK